ncbi:MAG: 6-bladed beta-propeller [Bacteroidaceae bacterium]|nr:6-bladed beta-propeller [Bacteroidaceae bacterium]
MKKFLLLSLIVSFTSCQDVKEINSSVKDILLDINTNQELRLSEIAETVEVIFLEQTDDSDIAMVERFIPYKDMYYVMSSIGFSNGRVHVFDKNGHFIQKIDKRGGGPGEYDDLQDVAINPLNDELIFMTQPQGIFRYDLKGNFISKVKGGYGMCVAADSLGNFYKTNRCYEETPDRLLMVNDRDSVSFGKIETDYFVMVNQYSFTNEFDCYNGRVYYSYPYSDTIYDVTGGKEVPVWYIDYNGKNLPIDKIFSVDKSMKESGKMKAGYQDYFRTDVFQITDDFLYVGSVDGEKHGIISLYSFKTGKVVSGHRLVDDMFFPYNTFTFRPFRMPIAVERDCLFWLVDPTWLLQGYEYYKENLSKEEWEAYCKRHPQVMEVCSKVDEESNPVLFKIKIKEF